MAKIWAKLINNDKIIKDCVIETEKRYGIDDFIEYLQNICYILDIPNPIVLSTHFEKFSEFNHVKFTSDDFVEELHAEKLVLEKA